MQPQRPGYVDRFLEGGVVLCVPHSVLARETASPSQTATQQGTKCESQARLWEGGSAAVHRGGFVLLSDVSVLRLTLLASGLCCCCCCRCVPSGANARRDRHR